MTMQVVMRRKSSHYMLTNRQLYRTTIEGEEKWKKESSREKFSLSSIPFHLTPEFRVYDQKPLNGRSLKIERWKSWAMRAEKKKWKEWDRDNTRNPCNKGPINNNKRIDDGFNFEKKNGPNKAELRKIRKKKLQNIQEGKRKESVSHWGLCLLATHPAIHPRFSPSSIAS